MACWVAGLLDERLFILRRLIVAAILSLDIFIRPCNPNLDAVFVGIALTGGLILQCFRPNLVNQLLEMQWVGAGRSFQMRDC